MPQLENGEDPIIVAALIDDDDDEESKQLTKEFLDQAKSSDTQDDDSGEADDDDDEEVDDPESDNPDDKSDDDDEEEKPSGTKPPEAIDAPKDDDVEDEQPPKGDDTDKKSRSERRAERKRQYLERLSAAPDDNEKRRRELLQDDYKPLDIQDGEYDPDQLIQDRQRYAQAQTRQALEQQRKFAQDENFWTSVEYEAKLLNTNPDFAFLDESNPAYDAKKAEHINDLYMKVIGFEMNLARDANGLPVVDAKGQPVMIPSIRRHDLGFKEFAEGYLEHMTDFSQDNEAEITRNVVKQRAHQGVRPGGSSRRGLGRLQQGDIAKMSEEDFEKHEAEIDRQINAELGIS